MNKEIVKNSKSSKEKKQYAGRELLMAMNLLGEDLVEISSGKEQEKQCSTKKHIAGKMRWVAAAVCSLCLIGGSVVFAASRLNWHHEKHVDPNNPQPNYSRYWVDFAIEPIPVDMITGPIREVEKTFKEDAANGIYPEDDSYPRGWVAEKIMTEQEAVDYVGYEGLKVTMLPDWNTWHIQLVAYGDWEGDLTKVVVSNHYKVGEKIHAQTVAEIYTENWNSEYRSTKMPFEDRENIQGEEYITKNGKTGLLLVSDPEYGSNSYCRMEGYIIEGNIVYSLALNFNGSLDEKSGVAEESVTKVMHEWMDQF